MVDLLRLKNHLLDRGILTEDQILQAEDYALTRKIPVEEAIVFLDMMDYQSLGRSLAEIYGKPYRCLLTSPPPEDAKKKVPLKFAERWKVFPVAYRSEKHLLTLAVENPEDQENLRQVESIFPAPLRLAYVVAPRPEIDKAIEIHYKGKFFAPAQELEVPEDFAIIMAKQENREEWSLEEKARTRRRILLLEPDLARANALKSLFRGEGYLDVIWALSPLEAAKHLREASYDLLLVNGRIFQPKGSWLEALSGTAPLPKISYYHLTPLLLGQEYPYHQMSEALIGTAAFLVRKDLRGNQGKLQEIQTRVRYCKLLAFRLHLQPGEVDGVVLAAWLSDEGLGRKLVEEIVTPYRLEEIFDTISQGGVQSRVEGAVLSLVMRYQALKKNEPEATKDINRLRSLLGVPFPSSQDQAVLEAFLHLIRDEEFLKKVGEPAGRILIVDPIEPDVAGVRLRLVNDGYEVESVSDAAQAVKLVTRTGFDLIISEVVLPGMDGLKFCRTFKENPETSHVPLFFLTKEDGQRLPAACLEAGAEDFFKKPADPELISLKIQRIMAVTRPEAPRRGVRGSLEEMSSFDFIQGLSAGDKHVEIILEKGDEKGQIFMQKGEIIHAQAGSLYGEEAFYKLMAWDKGEFLIVPCADFPPRSIYAGTMSLLMEGARLVDEAEGVK
jgi:CheY-like chemotaxis protein